jgi:hypothetical protein
MKKIMIAMSILASGNAMACQYGMDSSQRMDEVIQRGLPNATNITVDGLNDTTIISFSSIFSNQCPSDFRLSSPIRFVRNGKTCRGTIVLKYLDHNFYSGKISTFFCRTIK